MLEVRIFHTREAMGKEAAINVSDSIQRLLKQKEEINMIFAQHPHKAIS